MENIKSEITRLNLLGLSYQTIAKHVNAYLAAINSAEKTSAEGIRQIEKRHYVWGIKKDKAAAILAVGRRFK